MVVLILEELGVPYTIHSLRFVDVNPNVRMPGVYLNFLNRQG